MQRRWPGSEKMVGFMEVLIRLKFKKEIILVELCISNNAGKN